MSPDEIPHGIDGQSDNPWYSHTCGRCRNYGENQTCPAFPEGIPKEIWQARSGHRAPYPGDHGIQFHEISLPEPLPSRYDVPEFLMAKNSLQGKA